MPTPTFEPIATTTLSSAAASITFSSIPATYTDLRLVITSKIDTGTISNIYCAINSDTGTNYSETYLRGDGSAATSGRGTSSNYVNVLLSTSATQWALAQADFMSYRSSVYKPVLWQTSADLNGSGYVVRGISLWRNTTAIASISALVIGRNFVSGTTATLYGIKAA